MLLGAREADYKAHLSHLDAPMVCQSDVEAVVRLHYVIPDGSGEPRFRELARMLVRYITLYCFDALRRKDLSDPEKNALFMEARDLFRKSATSGQGGEILVYFLLESVLKAPQALRKMPLSTNPNEERKGSDGVHIRWNEELGLMDIYFAESKIWGDFGDALDDAFKSITKFHKNGMKQHELNLFATHFQLLDSELQDRVLTYVDGANAANTRLNHACLIGFDWGEYKCLDDTRRREFITQFKDRYLKWAAGALDKVEGQLGRFPYRHLRFEFFFVPFKDVQAFRDWFEEALRG